MSGHSKWANIQHRKSAQDIKRAKIFTKTIRELTIATRTGGPDPNTNPRLRTAIDHALSQNIPKNTIERAIKRGTGSIEDTHLEELTYEGYGPAGVAFLVRSTTDNRNRALSEIRHAFTKFGGHLGTSGSVAYLFPEKGLFVFPPTSNDNQILEVALDTPAEDVVINDDQSIEIISSPEDFASIQKRFEQAHLTPIFAEITRVPTNRISLETEAAEKVWHLTEWLEDLDDVQEVYTNASYPSDFFQGKTNT